MWFACIPTVRRLHLTASSGRRFSLLDAVYGAVPAAALWMTNDMDYPGDGMLTVSNRPVVEALAAMK